MSTIEKLEESLRVQPRSKLLLTEILPLYQQAQRWEPMIEVLRRLADIEAKPEVKSRLFYTMAQICRDKLDDPMRAVELFEEALDLNPLLLEAFDRIHKVLTPLREWKQLERSYRRMLGRVKGKGNTELESALWYALGLIYRDRLERSDAADESFRVAARLKAG